MHSLPYWKFPKLSFIGPNYYAVISYLTFPSPPEPLTYPSLYEFMYPRGFISGVIQYYLFVSDLFHLTECLEGSFMSHTSLFLLVQ